MEFYFAFGSNMSVRQMAARCPGCFYEGTARLPRWRWHINSRGVANILPDADSVVEGLLYSVNLDDRRNLDRSEGLHLGLYERKRVSVHLKRLVRPVEIAGLVADLEHSGFSARTIGVYELPAIAYVSEDITGGPIREEYIQRMTDAIRDAQTLGIVPRYFDLAVWPIVRQPVAEAQPVQPALVAGKRNRSGQPAADLDSSEILRRHRERYNNDLEYASAYDAYRDSKRADRLSKVVMVRQFLEAADGDQTLQASPQDSGQIDSARSTRGIDWIADNELVDHASDGPVRHRQRCNEGETKHELVEIG